MSVTAWLKHISANGLQRTKEDPEVFERVIFDLAPANSFDPLISDISELTSYQIGMLEEIMPDINLVCNQWTDHDVEEVQFLKELNPELYEYLKLDLYSIVTDEKNCYSVDLNTSWDYVSSLFQCGTLMKPATYLSTIDNRKSVNIFAGKLVDPNDTAYGAMRYQEVDEVLEMAQALSKIDVVEIRRRFEQSLKIKPPNFRCDWHEEIYPLLLEYCQEVKAFYATAAAKGFGVVNAIA